MKKLTVIIPFLNEGIQIRKTVQSIRDTAGENVDILLINDTSSDGYDYKKVAKEYCTTYILNDKRMGVAAARDLGVNSIETEHFLIIDGHMRFYHNNWWNVISENIENETRALYCCKCKPLDENFHLILDKPSYGAYINMDIKIKEYGLISAQWLRTDTFPEQEKNDIPCVLGASYAASKQYWQYIKGLEGLETYGYDEPYISLKVWMEGGRCVLLKNIEIGHMFRDKFPYTVNRIDPIYNCFIILETLFPDDYKEKVYNIHKRRNHPDFNLTLEKIAKNREKIKMLKQYYSQISTRSIGTVINFSETMRKRAIETMAI